MRKTWGGYAVVGGLMALATSGWFAWSAVLVLRWRAANPWSRQVPFDVWPWVHTVLFLAIAVAALRRRPRVRPWLVGGGALTMLLSGMAMRINRWSLVPVLFGAAMFACGLLWSPPDEGARG